MRSQALRPAATRIGLLRLMMLLGMLGLAGRAGQLTILNPEAAAHGKKQLDTTITVPASRGMILDRNHRELAISVDSPSVYVLPKLFQDRAGTLRQLAGALGVAPATVARRVGDRSGFTYLTRWIEEEKAHRIEELGLAGVGIEYEPRRTYPAGRMAGTLIGFADIDGHGRRGIEQMMDEWLRGAPQQVKVKRDAKGRLFGRITLDPRRAAGGAVALTLDSGLQAQAEAALAEMANQSQARRGLVIAVAPDTGDILTLAEWPGFDPNEFRRIPYTQSRSHSFHDAVEPGSIVKAFLVAAALENSVLTQETKIDTGEGWVRVPGKTFRDHHPYGILDPAGVLRHSSNVGAVWIAEKLGSESYFDTLTRFGFGRRSDSGFPSESAGLLRNWRKWRPVDRATASFGQGMNFTPIQLAMATAALANDGILMKPRLILAKRSATGDWENNPPVEKGRVLSRETARTVLKMMESVVSTEGTGRRAALAGVRVAGKTGTAQVLVAETGRYSSDRYTAWFIGVAPANDPKVAMVVALEEPRGKAHTGGALAAPLFATIATSQLARYGIMTQPEPIPPPAIPTWLVKEQQQQLLRDRARAAAPARTVAARSTQLATETVATPKRVRHLQKPPTHQRSSNSQRTVLVPDFRGVDVGDALELAAAQSLDLKITGASRGHVIGQAPPAGTVVIGRERTVQLRIGHSQEEG